MIADTYFCPGCGRLAMVKVDMCRDHITVHCANCPDWFAGNMQEVCALLNICPHGRRGFEVQRDGHRAYVANDDIRDWNLLNVVCWAAENP